jgi:hypothetical protein
VTAFSNLLRLHTACCLLNIGVAALLRSSAAAAAAAAAGLSLTQIPKISAIVADDPFLNTSKQGSTQYVSLNVKKMLPHISSSSSNKLLAAAAAGSPPEQLSMCQLLNYVQQNTWHATKELDVALRAVATYLVLQAHGYQLAGFPEADVPANSTQAHYSMRTGDASRSSDFELPRFATIHCIVLYDCLLASQQLTYQTQYAFELRWRIIYTLYVS